MWPAFGHPLLLLLLTLQNAFQSYVMLIWLHASSQSYHAALREAVCSSASLSQFFLQSLHAVVQG